LNIGWNFDKFLIDSNGKLILHGSSKSLKAFDFEEKIKILI
jgi:glutathione peroxidase-family protein